MNISHCWKSPTFVCMEQLKRKTNSHLYVVNSQSPTFECIKLRQKPSHLYVCWTAVKSPTLLCSQLPKPHICSYSHSPTSEYFELRKFSSPTFGEFWKTVHNHICWTTQAPQSRHSSPTFEYISTKAPHLWHFSDCGPTFDELDSQAPHLNCSLNF